MKALLARIHERVGDLWWYSAMIFVACRCGDVTTALSAYDTHRVLKPYQPDTSWGWKCAA